MLPEPTLNSYLMLSAVLFAIGTAGVFLRRNLITILLSVEVMLNAVEPDVRRGRPVLRQRGRADHRVLRHDRRGRRSGRGPGHHHRALPAPGIAQPGRLHVAEVVTACWLLIPLLPFAGFLLNATFGRRLPKSVSGGIATGGDGRWRSASRWRPSGAARQEPVGGVRAIDEDVYTWIASGRLNVPLAFRLDPLAAVMILVVTGIGTLIHLYSTAYMHEESDGEFARYFSYLNLFAAFMLVLVLGANFPVMFIGWEGVGLCSYLLIGFWFTKPSAADAGKKAFIVNRIGDFGFILGMLAIFATFGTLDFQGVARRGRGAARRGARSASLTAHHAAAVLGATGKSAQLPLYVWLPDAMEGPTPVSALIHAATMVTAGVYMIGRNAVLFSHAPITLEVVAVVGCLTALMAGTIGLVQNDIKRVLAYSTVSQLGYMFLAMGVGAFAAGIFHLYTHAFFKALLFLGSGAVIHALHGEQDLRRMGGLEGLAADHVLDVPDRHARDCRCAAAVRVLLEGRDPLEDLCRRAHRALGARGRDRVSHRHVHVPAVVSGVLRRAPARLTAHTAHGHARSPHARSRSWRLDMGSARRAAGDGHRARRARRSDRSSPATSACRTRSCTAAIASRRSWRPASSRRSARRPPRPPPRQARRRGSRAWADGVVHARRVCRHRRGHDVLPRAPERADGDGRAASPVCIGCCSTSTTWTRSTTRSSCSRSSDISTGCSGAASMPG